MVQTCFQGNYFATINIFRQKKFDIIFSIKTIFRGNKLATIKYFRTKNFLWKCFVQTCFRGNDFATIKNFKQKFLMKIFCANLLSRKWICNLKKNWTTNFYKTFGTNLFSKKLFCNHKIFRPTNISFKFWVQMCFRVNDFEPIKNFRPKNVRWNL